MELENWINPDKLCPSALAAMARSLADSPHRLLVIDDFLRADKAALLEGMFLHEARFETEYSLWDTEAGEAVKVTREQWLEAPEDKRGVFETAFAGPKPDARLSPGLVAYLKFQALLHASSFRVFMQRISGLELGAPLVPPPRSNGLGHFITLHSDFKDGSRALCCVYYVSTGWRSEFGGRFRQESVAGDAVEIDPLPNRLLVFPPDPERSHEVLPLTAAAGSWQRAACSFWFLGP